MTFTLKAAFVVNCSSFYVSCSRGEKLSLKLTQQQKLCVLPNALQRKIISACRSKPFFFFCLLKIALQVSVRSSLWFNRLVLWLQIRRYGVWSPLSVHLNRLNCSGGSEVLGRYSSISRYNYPCLPNHQWWVRALNPNCCCCLSAQNWKTCITVWFSQLQLSAWACFLSNKFTSDLHECFKKKKKMINRSLLSHMEKLLATHVERLLWSRQGSNPVPFGL
jgi:hypothetical protein